MSFFSFKAAVASSLNQAKNSDDEAQRREIHTLANSSSIETDRHAFL
jgi:hypothetical protein